MPIRRNPISGASSSSHLGKASPQDLNKQPGPSGSSYSQLGEDQIKQFNASDYNMAALKNDVRKSNDPTLTAYQTAMTIAQQAGARNENELFDYMDQILPHLLVDDEAKTFTDEFGNNRTTDRYSGVNAREIRDRRLGNNYGARAIDAFGDAIDAFNTGVGGVVDGVFDNTIGNFVGAINSEAGQAVKDFAKPEDIGGFVSGAEDIGLWMLPGGPLLAGGKALLDNRDNIYRSITGIDPLTLERVDDSQRATSAGAAIVDTALSSLPGLKAGKGLLKQASRMTGNKAKAAEESVAEAQKLVSSAEDDLAKMMTATDDELKATAKKWGVNVPEKELDNASRSKLMDDITAKINEPYTQAQQATTGAKAARSAARQNSKDAEKLLDEALTEEFPPGAPIPDNVGPAMELVEETSNAYKQAVRNANKMARQEKKAEAAAKNELTPVLIDSLKRGANIRKASEDVDAAKALFAEQEKGLKEITDSKEVFDKALASRNRGVMDRLTHWTPIKDMRRYKANPQEAVADVAASQEPSVYELAREAVKHGVPAEKLAGANPLAAPWYGMTNRFRTIGNRMRGGTTEELNREAARKIAGSDKKEELLNKAMEAAEKGKEKEANKLIEKALKIESKGKNADEIFNDLQNTNAMAAALRRARANGLGVGRIGKDALAATMLRGGMGYADTALQLAAQTGTDPHTALQDFGAMQQEGGIVSPLNAIALLAPGPKRYMSRLLPGKLNMPYHLARLNVLNDINRMNPALNSAIPTQEAVDYVMQPPAGNKKVKSKEEADDAVGNAVKQIAAGLQ